MTDHSQRPAPDPARPTAEDFANFVRLCVEISNLPLANWLGELNHGESVGIVLDPTLLRRYLHSAKAQFLKELIGVCLPIKLTVDNARNDPRIWQEFMAELEQGARSEV